MSLFLAYSTWKLLQQSHDFSCRNPADRSPLHPHEQFFSLPLQVDFFSTEATALTDAEIIPRKERQIKCKSASFFFFSPRGEGKDSRGLSWNELSLWSFSVWVPRGPAWVVWAVFHCHLVVQLQKLWLESSQKEKTHTGREMVRKRTTAP